MNHSFNLCALATFGAAALCPAIASAETSSNHGFRPPVLGGSFQGTGLVISATGSACTAAAGDTYTGTLSAGGRHKIWATFSEVQQTGTTPAALRVLEQSFALTSASKGTLAGTVTYGIAGATTTPTTAPFTATLAKNDAYSFSLTITYTYATCTEQDQIEFLGSI